MKIGKKIIDEVKRKSILDLATRLGISYSRTGTYRMCHCFKHEDRNPSLWLRPSTNTWRCEGCGIGGDNISLVMAHRNMTFPEAVQWLASAYGISTEPNNFKPRPMIHNCQSLNQQYLNSCYSTESPFCRALVSNNILTEEQMRRAALRYHLGATRDGGVIFWQIDRNERLLDGKIMFYRPDCHRDHDRHPTWVTSRLKQQKMLPNDYQPGHCLFGSHLLASFLGAYSCPTPEGGKMDSVSHAGGELIVAIVESEKSAIICSELFPKLQLPATGPELPVVWLATGGLSNLTLPALTATIPALKATIPALKAPTPTATVPAIKATVPASSAGGSPPGGPPSLRLILFPDTDTDGTTYRKWRETALAAQQELHLPIMVSNLLELNATADQKAKKIDITDYILKPQVK